MSFDFSFANRVNRLEAKAQELFADPEQFDFQQITALQIDALYAWMRVVKEGDHDERTIKRLLFINSEISEFVFNKKFLSFDVSVKPFTPLDSAEPTTDSEV